MTSKASTDDVVLDASGMVEYLIDTRLGGLVAARINEQKVHVPAHFDAEVLSALGRLHRSGQMKSDLVNRKLKHLASSPFVRHPLQPLTLAAWQHRHNLRLVDGLYVALAEQLDLRLITTDSALANVSPVAEFVGG
jgi:predicted nucleic acid-binding protein